MKQSKNGHWLVAVFGGNRKITYSKQTRQEQREVVEIKGRLGSIFIMLFRALKCRN